MSRVYLELLEFKMQNVKLSATLILATTEKLQLF
jgi:hypothetical protein